MKPMILPALALFVLLTGCVSTPEKIVATPQGSTVLTAISSNDRIAEDLKSATYNLDNAVAVGALLPDDPAPKCFHEVLKQTGLETTPGAEEPKSFVPKRDGILSDATILYVQAQQARQIAGRGAVSVPADCKALIGTFVIDGLRDARKLLGVVPGLRLLR